MAWYSWLTSLVESTADSGPVQATESMVPGLDYDQSDPDISLAGDQNAQNWRRITQGATDLTPLTQARMQELALYLSDKNPLAKGILVDYQDADGDWHGAEEIEE